MSLPMHHTAEWKLAREVLECHNKKNQARVRATDSTIQSLFHIYVMMQSNDFILNLCQVNDESSDKGSGLNYDDATRRLIAGSVKYRFTFRTPVYCTNRSGETVFLSRGRWVAPRLGMGGFAYTVIVGTFQPFKKSRQPCRSALKRSGTTRSAFTMRRTGGMEFPLKKVEKRRSPLSNSVQTLQVAMSVQCPHVEYFLLYATMPIVQVIRLAPNKV